MSLEPKSVTVKKTGHEKSLVSVCLAAKADSTKLKPMMVFKGADEKLVQWIKRIQKLCRCIFCQRMDGYEFSFRGRGKAKNTIRDENCKIGKT